MARRKRKTKRDAPAREGIPVVKLGSEFEWIDERLKIGLEAYPTFKRPLGKAEILINLALNMYYDNISQKWQPMDSLDISTVKNLARFFLADPPELTTDVYDDLRIDKNHRLEVKDVNVDAVMNGVEVNIDVAAGESHPGTIESLDYFFDHLILLVHSVTGTNNYGIIVYKFPDDTELTIVEHTNITARVFEFHKIIDYDKLLYNFLSIGTGTYSVRMIFRKYHKYYP